MYSHTVSVPTYLHVILTCALGVTAAFTKSETPKGKLLLLQLQLLQLLLPVNK